MASIAVSYSENLQVNFGGCSLGDTGTKFLMQNLCQSLLKNFCCKITGHLSINLDSKEITEKGVAYIAEVLKTTGALRKLELSYNRIGDKGLKSISEALIDNSSLIKLDLRRCSCTKNHEGEWSSTDQNAEEK